MVASTLTPELVREGESLLKELDTAEVPVNAALWFFFPEQNFWKLMLAIQDVDKVGPKAAYGRIQKALSRAEQHLTLDDIALWKPGAPLLQLLKTVVRTGPGVSGIRFSNNMINGQLISDAYIYRLT